ncbi:MAG: polymer-forming cytoskeletal protein [Pseudomonadota bacterium]
MGRYSAKRHTTGPTSLIAEGVTVRGDISGNRDLEVHGEVVGDSNVNGTVVIAEGGVWRGKLTARNVLVAGQVIGAVRASGEIDIAASARIEGTVTGGAIAVQQGAIVDGELKTLPDEKRSKTSDALQAPAAAAG